MRAAFLIALCALLLTAADNDAGRIMRPTDGAALASSDVDIVASAPNGKLALDGTDIVAEQSFPNVFHAVVKAGAGVHSLVLSWDGGKREIHFYTGADPPTGFTPFHQHPPLAGVACTQCHEVNKRGRFRFKGGCFDCHQPEGFVKVHTHDAARLEQCGMCHNAHGSSVKADLLYVKETACKMCHS
jgi:predicted CXXCH cytochrome family protein